MKYFLTSSPIDNNSDGFYEVNGFREKFISSLGKKINMLFVASDPDNYPMSSSFAKDIASHLEKEGVEVASINVIDNRNKVKAASLFKNADLVVLAGGHVPTQNKFFSSFPLKMLLSKYKGTLLGISAGTMNSGRYVYLMPEEEGETKSEECNRLEKGLGLTNLIIIPHYREQEEDYLDGINLYKDVVYPFFKERAVMCIPDGTYIYNDGNEEVICGECWSIIGGKREKISEVEEEVFVEKEDLL